MIKKHTLHQSHLTQAISMALTIGVGAAQADFSADFELSGLDGTNGVVFNGVATEDNAGRSVSAAGDINGDGFDDLVIGAPYASNGAQFAGKAYVVFGSAQGLPGTPLRLSESGLVITGANIYDSVGSSVSAAGDINGDGIDDLILGAENSSLGANYAGAAFVVFGNDQVLPQTLSVSDLDGSNGFAILGTTTYSSFGASVDEAGDINGDGFGDLVIGAPFTENGTVYVIFGGGQDWSPPQVLSDLNGTNGFRIDGVGVADSLGESVGGAGDVNGDGIDDLVMGASLAVAGDVVSGAAYVIFGTNKGFSSPFDLTSLDGSNGFRILGPSQGDWTGYAVSAAGDINGDAIGDLLIGAPRADPNGSSSGSTYVVFGSNQGWSESIDLSNLNGSNGFAIHGASAGDNSGHSVSAVGDVNNDAIDDLFIGAPLASPNGEASGASYVIFGSQQAWPSTLALSSLDGTGGFRVNGAGAGDQSGVSISAAGDMNSDGKSDFLVGAPLANPNGANSGAAYLVYDASSGNDADIIFFDGFEY